MRDFCLMLCSMLIGMVLTLGVLTYVVGTTATERTEHQGRLSAFAALEIGNR
jgi:hypothetical protein